MTPVPPGKPAADLSVSINPRQVQAKSAFTEKVTVTNHGPSPATNVVTTGSVPWHQPRIQSTATAGKTAGVLSAVPSPAPHCGHRSGRVLTIAAASA